MKVVLPFLIHFNQAGFIRDRFIGDTVRTIQDIMDLCDEHNMDGLLMMIDFEKAYDSVEWPFLLTALEKYNFGPMIIQWIKTFYNNIESCVTNNHITTQYFKVTRGLRQGDPLSSYLFVLVVELLSISIRKNENIKGINVLRNEIKLVQYADDTTAILQDTVSAENFLKTLDDFSKVSGLKVNQEKTKVMWLGNNNNNNNTLLHLKWTKEPFKVLGIYIGQDRVKCYELNTKSKIKKLKDQLLMWKQR